MTACRRRRCRGARPARPRSAPTLITPHAGELARLLTRLARGGGGRGHPRGRLGPSIRPRSGRCRCLGRRRPAQGRHNPRRVSHRRREGDPQPGRRSAVAGHGRRGRRVGRHPRHPGGRRTRSRECGVRGGTRSSMGWPPIEPTRAARCVRSRWLARFPVSSPPLLTAPNSLPDDPACPGTLSRDDFPTAGPPRGRASGLREPGCRAGAAAGCCAGMRGRRRSARRSSKAGAMVTVSSRWLGPPLPWCPPGWGRPGCPRRSRCGTTGSQVG